MKFFGIVRFWRATAIKDAASRPELFADLDKRFPGRGSDAAIRSYLLTQKFIPTAADAAIRAYRETKELVEKEGGGYDSSAAVAPAPLITVRAAAGLAAEIMPPRAEGKMRVVVTDSGIEIEAKLIDQAGIDRLINILQANKSLVPAPKADALTSDQIPIRGAATE